MRCKIDNCEFRTNVPEKDEPRQMLLHMFKHVVDELQSIDARLYRMETTAENIAANTLEVLPK